MILTPDQDRAVQDIAQRHGPSTLRISPRPPMGELSAVVEVLDDDEQVEATYRVLANGSIFAVGGHLRAVK